MNVIYCAAGNPRLYQIAIAHGFLYGARLPDTTYGPLYFADQDWRTPDRHAYMRALERERPHMATVLDWEREEQYATVLDWAEEAAQHVSRVVIIPKVLGSVHRIPARIGGADVVLGYSVPTRFAGTEVPLWEFAGRSVHLLGGSPHAQLACYAHLAGCCDVWSADGNYAQKMALRYAQFWTPGTAAFARNRWWPTLTEADGQRWEADAPYEAFARSCGAIQEAWRAAVMPQRERIGAA